MNQGISTIAHGDLNLSKQKSKRKKRRIIPEKCKILGKMASDMIIFYNTESSLHGFRYISDVDDVNPSFNRLPKGLKFTTRLVFIVSCIALSVLCVYLINLSYNRYKSNPTVTTISTNDYPIYNVRFPGVTLCNINKVYRPLTDKFIPYLLDAGIDMPLIIDFFEKLSALVNPEFIEGVYLKIYVILESMGYTSEKLMKELAQPCTNMLKKCLWLGKERSCNSIFQTVETAEGICCSFNYHVIKYELDFKNQNISFNSKDNVLYVSGAGRYAGLSVLMDPEEENYVSATRTYAGIEVIVHDPEEQPTIITANAQSNQDVQLQIAPSVIVSQPGVIDVPIQQRLCYFENEQPLRTTHKYTLISCMTQCKVDTILDLCSCIPFYFAELKLLTFSKHYRQCSLRDVNCLRTYRHIFNSLDVPVGTPGFNSSGDVGMKCDCLPNCSEQQYTSNILVGSRNNIKLSTPFFGNVNLTNLTSVHVYFKDLTCIQYSRSTYLKWDELLSQFGGIFGFCLGGSVLSIIEFIFIFTVRLFFYVKVESEQRKLAKQNQKKNQAPPSYNTATHVTSNSHEHKFLHYFNRNPFQFQRRN